MCIRIIEGRGLLETTQKNQISDHLQPPSLLASPTPIVRTPPMFTSGPSGMWVRAKVQNRLVKDVLPGLYLSVFSLAQRPGCVGKQADGTCYPPFRQCFD